jgi:hypothetical protein
MVSCCLINDQVEMEKRLLEERTGTWRLKLMELLKARAKADWSQGRW